MLEPTLAIYVLAIHRLAIAIDGYVMPVTQERQGKKAAEIPA